jgi:hypothetical protein
MVRRNTCISCIESLLLEQGAIFILLARHAQMIRRCFTRTALLSSASPARAHKPIDSVILSVLWFDCNIIGILLGRVLGITLNEVELRLTLAAADEVVHLPDGFGV